MKKLSGIIIIILALLSLPVHLPAGSLNDYLRVVSYDSEGLILDLRVPMPDIEEVWEGRDLYHKITIHGFVPATRVGSPQLLQIGTLLGIPESGRPAIEILETDSILLSGYNIHPAPKPIIIESDESRRLDFKFTLDKKIYMFNGFMPSNIAKVDFTGFMRDQKVIRVMLFPFQFNPVTGELKYYSRILVKVNFNAGTVEEETVSVRRRYRGGHPVRGKDNAYERLLKGALLNYEQIKQKNQK